MRKHWNWRRRLMTVWHSCVRSFRSLTGNDKWLGGPVRRAAAAYCHFEICSSVRSSCQLPQGCFTFPRHHGTMRWINTCTHRFYYAWCLLRPRAVSLVMRTNVFWAQAHQSKWRHKLVPWCMRAIDHSFLKRNQINSLAFHDQVLSQTWILLRFGLVGWKGCLMEMAKVIFLLW